MANFEASKNLLFLEKFELLIIGSVVSFDFFRFTVDQSLKRQKYMVHGFEARALKHIPKLLFKIGERLLKLCNCGPQYSADLENFTKKFIAYKFDAKGGKMTIGNYKMNGSNMATRRSSNR